MIAELRITPVTEGDQDFPHLVAEVLRIVQASRLQYMLNPMGTTLEGDLDEILEVVKRCHQELRKHTSRLLMELSIDDRAGAEGELVRSVEHVRELGVPLERLVATGEY